jgi:hypothetical protein
LFWKLCATERQELRWIKDQSNEIREPLAQFFIDEAQMPKAKKLRHNAVVSLGIIKMLDHPT